VILTDGSAFSDATVSAYVAGKLGTAAAGTCNAVTAAGGAYVANLQMPLLLTDPDNLSYGAGGWFEGMGLYDGVSDIKVFGGTKAVSNHVVDQVTDAAHTGSYIP
jgi:hypothetical protein